jgi:hypothetical protein
VNDYSPGSAAVPAAGRRRRRLWPVMLTGVLALTAATLASPAAAATAAHQAAGGRRALATGGRSRGGTPPRATARTAGARTRTGAPPQASAQASGAAAPRFFADIPVLSLGDSARLEVRDSSSGRLVWRAQGEFTSETGVAALAGGRPFVIAKLAGSGRSCSTRFYRFRLSDSGRPGRLIALGVPELHGVVAAMTVSANGAVVAYAMSGCAGKGTRGWLGILDSRPGRDRRWSDVDVAGESTGSVAVNGPLALSGRGSVLAFTGWDLAPGGRFIRQVVRVLRTSAADGVLARRSRVVRSSPVAAPTLAAAVLSPGGATVYACAVRRSPASHPVSETVRISAYGTATGRLRRTLAVLSEPHVTDQSAVSCPLALTGSGRYLLAPYAVLYPRSLMGNTVVRAVRLDLSSRRVKVLRMVFPHTGPPDQSGILGMYVAW